MADLTNTTLLIRVIATVDEGSIADIFFRYTLIYRSFTEYLSVRAGIILAKGGCNKECNTKHDKKLHFGAFCDPRK
jgi:hypothetical protein